MKAFHAIISRVELLKEVANEERGKWYMVHRGILTNLIEKERLEIDTYLKFQDGI